MVKEDNDILVIKLKSGEKLYVEYNQWAIDSGYLIIDASLMVIAVDNIEYFHVIGVNLIDADKIDGTEVIPEEF